MSQPSVEEILKRFHQEGNSKGRAALKKQTDQNISKLKYVKHLKLDVHYLITQDRGEPVLLVYVKSGNDYRFRRAIVNNGRWVADD